MSLYSPDDLDQRPSEPAVFCRLMPIEPRSAPGIEPQDHEEPPGRRLPRWPLIAIAFAALITMIWNLLLVWALIGAILS